MKSLDTRRGWSVVFAIMAGFFVLIGGLFLFKQPSDRPAFIVSILMAWMCLIYAFYLLTRRPS